MHSSGLGSQALFIQSDTIESLTTVLYHPWVHLWYNRSLSLCQLLIILHYCWHSYLLTRVSTWRNKELTFQNCTQSITLQISKHRLLPDASLPGIFSHSHYCLETLLLAAAVLSACPLQWSNEDSSNTSCRFAITRLFAGWPMMDLLLWSYYCPSYVVGPSTTDIISVRHQVLSPAQR